MDLLQKELLETQNSYDIQNQKVQKLKKQFDEYNEISFIPQSTKDEMKKAYNDEVTKLNVQTKKIQEIKQQIKAIQEFESEREKKLNTLQSLQKELSNTKNLYDLQKNNVKALRSQLDSFLQDPDLSSNPSFSNIIKNIEEKYKTGMNKLSSLENKIKQLNGEITQVQNVTQPLSPPQQSSAEDDYNKQLELVKNLVDAQNTLTHDPGSVIQEGKLEEYQKNYVSAIQKLNKFNENLKNMQQRTEQDIKETSKKIVNYKKTLNENQQKFDKYSKDIKSKMQLVATRDRMLQLSQERNVYKKKVINVLISIVVALLVAVVAAYTFYGKSLQK